MCTVSLIVGELLSELGVDVSNSCAPITKSGPGISPGKATNNYTIVELGAASFFVQSINFVDGNLTTVRSGTPRRVTGQECLRCMDDIHNPSIISSCSVTLQKVYKKGMLKVSIRKTNGPFGTITSHFINLETGERMRGMGDITRNGAHWASFVVFSRNPQSLDISYIEYANQAHLNALFQKAAGAPGIEIAEETLTEVLEHRVHCGLNELSLKSFLEAIMVYRTIQLENPTVLHYFNDSASRFELLSKEDIYRAVLSLKIIDDQHNASSLYQVYTSCAVYNWYFIIPFLCSLVLVMLLGTTSVIMGAVSCGKYNKSRHGIPYNSHTWFRHVRNGGAGNHALVNSIDKTRSGYFESIFDEMVLEDDGSRGSNYLRIVMCSRGDQNVALEDGLTQEDMGVEEFSAYSQEG